MKQQFFLGFVVLLVSLGGIWIYVSASIQSSSSALPQTNFFIDSTGFVSSSSHLDHENHLELTLSIGSTTTYPGGWNSISLSENNTLQTANNVSASDNWVIQLPSLVCSGIDSIGVGVFRGFYSIQNISKASTAQLIIGSQSYPTACVNFANSDSYDFEPDSSLFTPTGCQDCNASLSYDFFFNSTWSDSPSGVVLSPLSPGIYSVVAADEWGQIVILHYGVGVVQVSLAGPLTSSNSLGPRVLITLINAGTEPILQLNASLRLESQFSFASSFSFSFPVSTSNPLFPGGAVENSETLQDAGFSSGQSYHVIVSAELESGVRIVYIQAIPISPPV
jgi:hypothetical protein